MKYKVRQLQSVKRLIQCASRPEATAPELDMVCQEAQQMMESAVSRGTGLAQVVESLSAHPNIDLAVLQSLLKDHFEVAVPGFVRNPLLPFLALESPVFWEMLPEDTVGALVRRSDLPSPAAQVLRNYHHPWYALEAETHVACSGELPPESYREALRWLEGRMAGIIARQTNRNTRLLLFDMAEAGMVPAWVAQGQDPEEQDRDPEEDEFFQDMWGDVFERPVPEWVAEGRYAKEAMLRWLNNLSNDLSDLVWDAVEVRRNAVMRLARHPDTHPAALCELLREREIAVRRAIRRHPNVDDRLLALLREEMVDACGSLLNSPYGYFVAYHCAPFGPRTVQSILSTGGFLSRFAIAQQLLRAPRRTDRERCPQLIDDPNRYVRAIARNPALLMSKS